MAQHEADAASQKAINMISDISKHAKEYPFGTINFNRPLVKKTMAHTKKLSLQRKLLTRESLETYNSVKNGEDNPQLHVDMNVWDPLMKKFRNRHEKPEVSKRGEIFYYKKG